ncbi:LysR family transcriptional regulator [Luteipulveratus flavus]|uniref:LysR substrate-binding domain-containing protein n=1 Tax=Luteipulveratus flavus TaxID=3031728 RepID=A0ABT6C2X7_9MICO|nr:LysR family transcriptional regulator [Luteipulveratus sp. YIM 133296]MDF8262986.1 LysR substrate-binding domain-containing protein [Luteipulveratus sp. YIM 133296]
MSGTLDIAPLRSLVAVAAAGGFRRAAVTLHLTQSAVSQHVRRLEQTTGAPLVERVGRRTRFTPDGERLLVEARRILAAHDAALAQFETSRSDVLTIGAAQHAAEILLPEMMPVVRERLPEKEIRLRLDRTRTVQEMVESGAIDVAVLTALGAPPAAHRSRLHLRWYAAQGWERPAQAPLPLVVFDAPCFMRQPSFDTLTDAGVRWRIVAEAGDLSGAQSAARAGMGVLLLPTLGRPPEGLQAVASLPEPPDVHMAVRTGPHTPKVVADAVRGAVRRAMQG